MEYAVAPIFFGIVTGAVGKYKGSSFTIWFVVGALLPVIGLIAAIASRTEKLDPRRECPNCGAIVGISNQVCLRCGEDLEYPTELVAPKGYTFADPDPDTAEVAEPAETRK